MKDLLAALKGGLIVSCQAPNGSPLRSPQLMAALAAAACAGGAAGIRANGPADVAAIARTVQVPILGIDKQVDARGLRVITPDLAAARALAAAGAHVIAVELTDQARPDWEAAGALVRAIRDELRRPVMADVSTLAEGRKAVQAGADLVATTMAGYTGYTARTEEPDLDLLAALVRELPVPVVAEGRYHTPALARRALEAGAFAVVVGSAITSPAFIARRFADALRAPPEDR
jgi:N-acylglucosamine-6-phosphate 2-epimerase